VPQFAPSASTALVVLCDFRKAYDTVDRDFLLDVADEMGLGAGFRHWVRLLLSDTRATATVSSAYATPRRFHAGVRQGCPLAPLLYLLVTQTLLAWLDHEGLGIALGSLRLLGTMYADDAKIFVEPSQVGRVGGV
jgi:hypothetical protein